MFSVRTGFAIAVSGIWIFLYVLQNILFLHKIVALFQLTSFLLSSPPVTILA
jgi:hypothetical protein